MQHSAYASKPFKISTKFAVSAEKQKQFEKSEKGATSVNLSPRSCRLRLAALGLGNARVHWNPRQPDGVVVVVPGDFWKERDQPQNLLCHFPVTGTVGDGAGKPAGQADGAFLRRER